MNLKKKIHQPLQLLTLTGSEGKYGLFYLKKITISNLFADSKGATTLKLCIIQLLYF